MQIKRKVPLQVHVLVSTSFSDGFGADLYFRLTIILSGLLQTFFP